MPKISVIMSVYKEPLEWIRESIDSILNQTFRDFEFIIVNDNPLRKENAEILSEYAIKDKRICILYNEVNIGLTRSLNRALLVAKGKYVARMDADDISAPNRFELQIQKLSEGVSFVYSSIDYIDEQGRNVEGLSLSPRFMDSEFFVFNPIPHPTVMFSSSLLALRNPLYNEEYKRSQDYDLWTFMYLNGVQFEKIDKTLLHYRLSESQITNKNRSEQRKDFERIRERLILRYLAQHDVNVNVNIPIEVQLNDIYNVLLKKYVDKEFISDSISAIMYLLTYSILPQRRWAIFDYYFKSVSSHYSIRRNIYMILRVFGLKIIPFYKLKYEMR